MKKSITSINPKAKVKERSSKKITKYLVTIQFILTIILIISSIIAIFKHGLINLVGLILGITLIDMGINNNLIYKRKGLTLIYIIIGLIVAIIFIFKWLGM